MQRSILFTIGIIFLLSNFLLAQTARVQVIHNSADVAAGTVDIYVNAVSNDPPAIPDFNFRDATPFLDLPAGVTLNIGVAPGNSASVNDTLANFQVMLTANETYTVFANGVLDPNTYANNPDGKSTAFTLFVKSMSRESGQGSGVDVFVLHGSTDAPSVEVQARELGSAVLVDSAAYGDITGYIEASATDFTIDLYLADGVSYVGSFIAPLTGLGGGAAAIFASGFLDPASNQSGPAFGLFAALPNGTVVELVPGIVPVELSSFTATSIGDDVSLNWQTATETNNLGFEIQRKAEGDFSTIAFVDGAGTTTEVKNYSYTDSKLSNGKYTYRLKQVDFDGTFDYSDEIQVEILGPEEFILEQNFPNPFNPSTQIKFSIPVDSDVSLKIFNLLGEEVSTLINSRLAAGVQEVDFNAAGLNSGVYFYQVTAKGINGNDFSSVKKMILTK